MGRVTSGNDRSRTEDSVAGTIATRLGGVTLAAVAALTFLTACSSPMGTLPGSSAAPSATARPVVDAKRPAHTEGPYRVVSVTDGDTIRVDIDGTSTRVRLIGIDTPEVKDPRKPVQCFGEQASQRAHKMTDARKVWLEFDPTQDRTDRYGRLLAYVWVDGGGMANEAMVRDGFAHEYTYYRPYKYRSKFKAAERSAREGGRGLWSTSTCSGDTTQSVP